MGVIKGDTRSLDYKRTRGGGVVAFGLRELRALNHLQRSSCNFTEDNPKPAPGVKKALRVFFTCFCGVGGLQEVSLHHPIEFLELAYTSYMSPVTLNFEKACHVPLRRAAPAIATDLSSA